MAETATAIWERLQALEERNRRLRARVAALQQEQAAAPTPRRIPTAVGGVCHATMAPPTAWEPRPPVSAETAGPSSPAHQSQASSRTGGTTMNPIGRRTTNDMDSTGGTDDEQDG